MKSAKGFSREKKAEGSNIKLGIKQYYKATVKMGNRSGEERQ